MFIVGKYDDINRNVLVLGAGILKLLKNKNFQVENLFQECRKNKGIELNQFLNLLTFLWILGLVDLRDNKLSLKKSR